MTTLTTSALSTEVLADALLTLDQITTGSQAAQQRLEIASHSAPMKQN